MIICDKCNHYSVSPAGCVETCWATLISSKHIIHMPDDYIRERMNGNKKHCKEFKKIVDHTK